MEKEEIFERLHRAVMALRQRINHERYVSGHHDVGIPVFKLNPVDREDICRLDEDLFARKGYAEAEAIGNALSNYDLTVLGKALVVTFELDHRTPSLFENL